MVPDLIQVLVLVRVWGFKSPSGQTKKASSKRLELFVFKITEEN